MEYVPGVPITDYCDQKRLKIRERLELFIKVCEGVQHAHQKAIIHRDLKPANILVAEVDGKPIPRIIDFGLAKIDHAVIEVHRASSGQPRLPLRVIRRAVPIVVDGFDRTLEGITIAHITTRSRSTIAMFRQVSTSGIMAKR
jgi:serine/threonine protein kinase